MPDDLPDFNNPDPEHIVRAEARKQGVDPELAVRMMNRESRGNPRAVSPKGAQGLMQVMPGTAKLMGGGNLNDPYDNARLGVGYLKKQLGDFGGNQQLAAAAYNAGPGNVRKAGNRVPRFKETQAYVKQVAPTSDGLPDFGTPDDGLPDFSDAAVSPVPPAKSTAPKPYDPTASSVSVMPDSATPYGPPDNPPPQTPRATRRKPDIIASRLGAPPVAQPVNQPAGTSALRALRQKGTVAAEPTAQDWQQWSDANAANRQNQTFGVLPSLTQRITPEYQAQQRAEREAVGHQAQSDEASRQARVQAVKTIASKSFGVPEWAIPDAAVEGAADAASALLTKGGNMVAGLPQIGPDAISGPIGLKHLQPIAKQAGGAVRRLGETIGSAGAPEGMRKELAQGLGGMALDIGASGGNPIVAGVEGYMEAKGQGASESDALMHGATVAATFEGMGQGGKIVNRLIPGTGILPKLLRFGGRTAANVAIPEAINTSARLIQGKPVVAPDLDSIARQLPMAAAFGVMGGHEEPTAEGRPVGGLVGRETLPEGVQPRPTEPTVQAAPPVETPTETQPGAKPVEPPAPITPAVESTILPERQGEIVGETPTEVPGVEGKISRANKARRSAERELETDTLTHDPENGVFIGSRKAMDKALPAAERDNNTSVISFDANNFGQVNKLQGETAGDTLLKRMAAAIHQAADEHGMGGRVFRKGGDEFVVLAPKDVADAIRARAEDLFGAHEVAGEYKGKPKSVTVSLSGSTGNTFDEANAPLQAAKAARKAALSPVERLDEALGTPAAAEQGAAKEPWQQTRDEYLKTPKDRSRNPELNIIDPNGTIVLGTEGKEVRVTKMSNEDAYAQKLITKKQYLENKYPSGLGKDTIHNRQEAILEHHHAVYNALLEGKDVPAEVRAEYPVFSDEYIDRHRKFNRPLPRIATPAEPPGERTTGIKNAVTESERAEQGKSPVEVEGRRTFQAAWDTARSKVASGEIDPRSLAAALSKKPRALNAEESAALIQDRMKLQNDHKATMMQLNDAIAKGDETAETEARIRLKQTEDAIQTNDEAARRTGYEQGLGLAARRMMAREDYSLANLVQRAKVARGGEIPDEVRGKLETLAKQIEEKDAAIAARDAKIADLEASRAIQRTINTEQRNARSQRRATTKKALDDEFAQLKDDLAQARKESGNIAAAGLASLDPEGKLTPIIAKMARNRIQAGITDVAELIDSVYSTIKDKVEGLTREDVRDALAGYGVSGTPDEATLRAQLHELKRQLGELPKRTEDQKQAAAQTRMRNQIAELQGRIARGDYSKPAKRAPLEYDPEAKRLEADRNRLKLQVETEMRKQEDANKGTASKAADFLLKYRRAVVLSGVRTIGKLTAAAVGRGVSSVAEEGIGAGLSKIPGIRNIAEMAPREGGFSGAAEKAAIKAAFSKETLKQAGKVAKTGVSDIDALYGGKAAHDPEFIEMFGRLHGALKTPVKQAEFFRSVQKRSEFEFRQAIKNGMTPEEATAHLAKDSTQLMIGAKAYEDANRAIFMNDNGLVKLYKQMLGGMERVGQEEGIGGLAGRVASRGARFLLPVVKVPSNYVAEASSYAVGGPKAAIRLALSKGVKNLTPEQADYIMRNLKKQTVGAAMMALGYFTADKVGGYYTGKKDDKEPKEGTAYGIPKTLSHIPALEMLQFGATLKHVLDKERGGANRAEAVPSAAYAAGKGLVSEIPFFNEIGRLSEGLQNFQTAQKFVGEQGRSLLIPPDVQYGARYFDKDRRGNPVQRKPSGFLDELKVGMPGLRRSVPAR